MANFVVSSVLGSVSSSKNSVLNTFSNNPLNSIFNSEDSWKKDKITPRLNDLTVQKSCYNDVIPTIYGTVRLAGNIIWATDIKEVENTYISEYRTGKGGKKISQNNVEYYYYANVAICIGNGEINELKRAWADTELIDLSKYNYRFYKGTEEQEADFLIQSVEGLENTPAYRGLSYIVFDNLPLVEFGNRIPNFTFEVSRIPKTEKDAENLITGVNLIPGCGEFVYDTEVFFKNEGIEWMGEWKPTGEVKRLNQNNNNGVSDAVLSIQQLKNTLPKCEWVAPVVVWFANSTNIENCNIEPKVEFKLNTSISANITTPENWQVAGRNRNMANLVSLDENGNVRYGGTINDNSILRYVKYLKEQNFKVMLYPMMFMDMKNKPWRGYLTGNANNINNFFNKTNGYNAFILHYANLLKDYLDAFIIGSEMIGLTKIYSDVNGNYDFPAVDCFIELSNSVRQILGNKVQIGYAADWSEYHHTNNGWYNMDKLWSSDNIDFIGIDAYFPLTDKEEELITKSDIINGWASGEGYDWVYADSNRNEKINIEPKWAWKNLEWWWTNFHINPNGNKTTWIPKSKPIWFTEYGFASVDGTTNEPNKFYDPNSIDGGFPRFSKGEISNFSQKQAIQATEEKWLNSNMIKQKFLWCWDARPFPFFPNKLETWSDGKVFPYGHWINGKLTDLLFSNMVFSLFSDANINKNCIGNIDIYNTIDGIALNNTVKVNEVLNLLKKIFFFDYYEKEGQLYIDFKKTSSALNIDEQDLIEFENGIFLKTETFTESELPKKLNLSYISKDLDYSIFNTYCERVTVNTFLEENETLPVVINSNRAFEIAEKLLYSIWLEKIIYNFKLSSKYLYLNVSDIITLIVNNNNLILRICSILIDKNNILEIKAVSCDTSLYQFKKEENSQNNVEILPNIGKTNIEAFELPAIKNFDHPEVFFATNSEETGWKGCAIYSAKKDSNNFQIINESRNNSIIGICLNSLGTAKPYCFDYKNKLYIYFNKNISTEILQTIKMFDLLDGANIALVGNEILQFEKIELQDNGSFCIKNLLRGQYGTEEHINNHIKDEKFIFINKGLTSNNFTNNDIQADYNFRAITFSDNSENFTSKTLKITGKNLNYFYIVHKKIRKITNGYKITWQIVNKNYIVWNNNSPNNIKGEYLVNILNNENQVIRVLRVINDNFCIYTNDMIQEDEIQNWKVEIVENINM